MKQSTYLGICLLCIGLTTCIPDSIDADGMSMAGGLMLAGVLIIAAALCVWKGGLDRDCKMRQLPPVLEHQHQSDHPADRLCLPAVRRERKETSL